MYKDDGYHGYYKIGIGSITAGQLSFSAGAPSELSKITNNEFFYSLADSFSNFKISNENALLADFYELSVNGGALYRVLGSSRHSMIRYVYVDRDVSITGNGKITYLTCDCEKKYDYCDCEEQYGTCYCVRTLTTTNLNLNFKAGWNALHEEEFYSNDNDIYTLSLSNPSYLRWALSDYDSW